MYLEENGNMDVIRRGFRMFLSVIAIGLLAGSVLAEDATPVSVRAITEKVLNWQIKTFEDQGKYRALPANPKSWNSGQKKYDDLDWANAALYIGMNEWCEAASNERVTDFLKTIGTRNAWKLGARPYNADDHAVGQLYLSLYEQEEDPAMIAPLQERFDWILANQKTGSLERVGSDWNSRWWWSDALFMAPPTWARLARITGDQKYLDFMDKEFKATRALLFNKDDSLFSRDSSMIPRKEKNGRPLYWARGNGWVLGGLALMIPDLPANWAGRDFYTQFVWEMAESLKVCQRADGTWSMGLLGGEEGYPVKETSGTGLITFGLAWAVNNDCVDRATYEPIVLRAWYALTQCVTEDGMLGYVQPVGAAPGDSFPNYTEVYGVGAFAAAGAEVYKMLGGKPLGSDSGSSVAQAAGDAAPERANTKALTASGGAVKAVTQTQASGTAREVISLNPGWRYFKGEAPSAENGEFDDSSWADVNVPHHWYNENAGQRDTIYSHGISWYRKWVEWDASQKGRSVFLEFDGFGRTAVVYVNGKQVGTHRNAYGRYRVDISEALVVGEKNLIAVRIDNKHSADMVGVEPRRIGWAPFGGIYRDISLIVTEPVHIETMDNGSSGVKVTPSKISANSAVIQIIAQLSNDSSEEAVVSIKTVILDAAGKAVVEMKSAKRLPGMGHDSTRMITRLEKPHLWQGVDDPYLYSARVEVLAKDGTQLDVVEVPFGIRAYRFDPDKGFFLNEKPYRLQGVSLHQERTEAGWCLTPEMVKEDLDLILEMGANSVRSHYQMSDTFYEQCARVGMLVWCEIPFWQYKRAPKPLMDNAKLQLREAILQNYNNPAILIWSVGNECYVRYPEIRAAISEMHDYVHSLDDTRVTTYANPRNFGDIPQLVSELTDIATYNWYCGWYIDTKGPKGPAGRVGELADSYHAYYPNQSIGISEAGCSACIDQHEQNPRRPNPTGKWFPEEYQNFLHETYWKQVEERPFIYGTYIWCMFDFMVPDWSRGTAPHMNWKGMVTRDRKTRKDIYFYYKANWTETPVLYITSRRHTTRKDAVTPIKIYSNCENVRLTVNGIAQKAVSPELCVFKWSEITLKPGKNTIQVTGERAGKPFRDECTWTYEKPVPAE